MDKKKTPVSFFDIFQIGIELEGEFKEAPGDILQEWEIDDDGSIRVENDGYDHELRTDIIGSEREEKMYIKDLARLTENKDSKYFAYNNPSCGTHIHFDFKDNYKLDTSDLYVFDTMDFEKYFFSRYFSRFKKEKFINRVNNNYSLATLWFKLSNSPKKRIIANQGPSVYTAENSIKRKSEKGKYLWMTMYGLREGLGAELRIFPHIQSVSGLKAILQFAKETLLSYLLLKRTQERLKAIKIYNEEVCKCIISPSKLNEFEKIVLARLRANGASLSNEYACGDIRLMLASLYKRRKKAFTLKENSSSIEPEFSEIPF